ASLRGRRGGPRAARVPRRRRASGRRSPGTRSAPPRPLPETRSCPRARPRRDSKPPRDCPHLPRNPHRLASARTREESGAALVSATPTRRRERALSEAEAYARCHGHRALCPVRATVAPERDERIRIALMRALEELRP